MSNVIYIIIVIILIIQCSDQDNNDKVLSRRKRYLAFPEGATLSVAICMTVQTGITPGEIFTEAINWGISYDLPNETKTIKDFIKPTNLMKRRYRRDLYSKMETIMNSMGYNGRTCILRSLCEASSQFTIKDNTLFDRILKIVFSFTAEGLLDSEPNEHHVYKTASQQLDDKRDNLDCTSSYPCPFSLIDLALGFYS